MHQMKYRKNLCLLNISINLKLFFYVITLWIRTNNYVNIFEKISIIAAEINEDLIEGNNYFETFIELPDDTYTSGMARNGIRVNSLKWPHGVIPYEISTEFNQIEHDRIVNALKFFNVKTCIQVIPKQQNHFDYVLYKPGKGCGTLVGYNKLKSRPHEVVFNDYCIKLPEAIQHETMHVMGIFHEQCRWDRDEYIEILWQNIEKNQQKNFIKIPKIIADSYGVEYDFNSLMHYGPTAFKKKNSNITMKVKQKNGHITDEIKLGQLGYATPGDIIKMNRMYNCDHSNDY